MLRENFIVKILFSSLLVSFFGLSHNQAVEPRIVNGFNVTSMNGFKHLVSIRSVAYETRYGNGHRCGGSLINNRTVLTAAHCLYDGKTLLKASSLVMAMGSLNRWTREANTLYIQASKVVPHKGYVPDTFANDIALIILATDVPANHPTVEPIPLASSAPTAGRVCQISGWGTLYFEENNPPQPDRLQAGNVTINSRSDCNRPESHRGNVQREMFCAGSFSGARIVDSCQGDSGGPLTCDGILQGVTSHGFECARTNFPGVYMDVNSYRSWISANDSTRAVANFLIILSALWLSIFYGKA